MKLILVLIFFSISVNSFIQNFTLKELLILQKYDLDKFDSLALTKNYQFQEIKTIGIDTFYSFAYKLDITTGRAKKFLQYSTPEKGTFIAYVTLDTKEYSSLKREAKKIGYIFSKQENLNGSLILIYSKGNNTLQFVTQIGDYGNKYSIRLRGL